jgi:hypothetical protein
VEKITQQEIERFEELIDIPDWMRDGTGFGAEARQENKECWELWEKIKEHLKNEIL